MGDEVAVIEILDLENDFVYTPISLRGSTKKDPIPVEKYTQDLLHRPILPSLINLDDYEDDDLRFITVNTHPFRKKPFKYPSVTEPGESSSSSSSKHPVTIVLEEEEEEEEEDVTLACEICCEPKPQNEFFRIKGCAHTYCNECMSRYVASKIQENVTSINCPAVSCSAVLEPAFCQSILPGEVFDRWGNALCENLILGAQKFYCPFKDCSALLIDDGDQVVTESECPHCRRMFCAQCKVAWHVGIECGEFQKLGQGEREREDIMLMKLAKDKKWQRCPMCKFYVDRSDGCLFMKCRCGHMFCYHCAAPMKADNHNCTKCVR